MDDSQLPTIQRPVETVGHFLKASTDMQLGVIFTMFVANDKMFPLANASLDYAMHAS